MRFRRSSYVFVLFADRVEVDIAAFFKGGVSLSHETQAVGVSLLTGNTEVFNHQVLSMFAATNAQTWQSCDELRKQFGLASKTIKRLARMGFLLSDAKDRESLSLRERDKRLNRTGWNPYQALSYIVGRWQDEGSDIELGDELFHVLETYEQLIEAHGPPPPHFHQVEGSKFTALPKTQKQGRLFELLLARQTARSFRTDQSLSMENLSTLLRYTFGVQGAMRVTDDYILLKKTSPSGGALHPVEAYPLVLDVEGLTPGFYHYNVREHGLDLIRKVTTDEGRELARQFTAGQYYFASANVLIILTARFDRNFWKYRNDSKALRILELDAAHLGQTFYLLGTELGLGTFTTAAIVDESIEKLIGLPLFLEGAISVLGCGYPVDESCPGGADFSAPIPDGPYSAAS